MRPIAKSKFGRILTRFLLQWAAITAIQTAWDTQTMIAITGAKGQLGGELLQRLGERALALDLPSFDLTDHAGAEKVLLEARPSVIINCAAYTQVDRAEGDVEKCRAVNAAAVGALARVANQLNALLVQISTDYVYCGIARVGEPFNESDSAAPLGVYSITKYEGEQEASQANKHLIVRTCGLYCHTPGGPVRGKNFVDTMLALAQDKRELKIVADQVCTPTFVPHLAQALIKLMECDARGLFHVTNDGEATWRHFAETIFKMAGIPMQLHAITTQEYGAAAPRPAYSVLNTSKAARILGSKLPNWQDALRERLALLGY